MWRLHAWIAVGPLHYLVHVRLRGRGRIMLPDPVTLRRPKRFGLVFAKTEWRLFTLGAGLAIWRGLGAKGCNLCEHERQAEGVGYD